jgi:hypothetical protein
MLKTLQEELVQAAGGDRHGLGTATPRILAVQLYISESGEALAVITTNAATSVRVAASTSGMPSDATVRAAALQTLDASGILTTGVLLTTVPGDVAYVKVFAYETVAGAGLESPAATATIKMGTRKRGFVWDDGLYALKSSDTAGKETNDDLFISNTKTVKVGTVASPSAITKLLRIPHGEFVLTSTAQNLVFDFGRIFYNGGGAVDQKAIASILVPKGVTITKIKAHMFRNAVGDKAEVEFRRNAATGSTTTLLATLTHSTTGNQTVEASLTEGPVGDNTYLAWLKLQGAAAGDASLSWLELEYTMPSYDKGI